MPDPRRPPPPSTITVWRRHPGYVGAYGVDLFLAVGLGVTALVGDPDRFVAASYAAVRFTGVTAWGWALLCGAGLLMVAVACSARVTMLALAVAAFQYLTLGAYFWIAAANDPTVAWWGALVFLALGAWHLTQANEYRRAQPDPRAVR